MIEQISGILIQKTPTFCVLDCHGIGLGLHISLNSYAQLGEPGEESRLLTHLIVRDDSLQLYGFASAEERELFRKLIAVSGIGPRLAIAILSGLTPGDLVQAIANEDYQLLTHIPGVGKKTAQRVVLELKEKLVKTREAATPQFSPLRPSTLREEALLALVTLGYKQNEALSAINKVLARTEGELPLEEIIKLALKEI